VVASKQTRLKLRKGFMAAPLRYKVLMVSQFNDVDSKIIQKGLIQAINPTEANKLLPGPSDRLLPSAKRSKWMLRAVSQVGDFDINVLLYRGSPVALYFKRPISIVEPEEGDPAPEGYVEDENDLWVRLDLFSKSPRQLVGSVRGELADKNAEIERLKDEVLTLRSIVGDDVDSYKQMKRELATLKSKPLSKSRKK
jgi:hypothetical protein